MRGREIGPLCRGEEVENHGVSSLCVEGEGDGLMKKRGEGQGRGRRNNCVRRGGCFRKGRKGEEGGVNECESV